MAMIRKTITVTKKMDAWIKSRVKSGDYGNDSEYLRGLVRQDKIKHEATELATVELRRLIQEGIDSGTSKRTFDEIWAEGMQRARIKQARSA